MEYIDGGWKFYISSRDCADISADLGMLAAGVGTTGGIVSIIAGFIGTVAPTVFVGVLTTVVSGGLGAFSAYFSKAANHKGIKVHWFSMKIQY